MIGKGVDGKCGIPVAKEAVSISETSDNFYHITLRNIPEDSHLQTIALCPAFRSSLYSGLLLKKQITSHIQIMRGILDRNKCLL
jgi:hypothetical protein